MRRRAVKNQKVKAIVDEEVILTPFERAFLARLQAQREQGHHLSDWQSELLERFCPDKTP